MVDFVLHSVDSLVVNAVHRSVVIVVVKDAVVAVDVLTAAAAVVVVEVAVENAVAADSYRHCYPATHCVEVGMMARTASRVSSCLKIIAMTRGSTSLQSSEMFNRVMSCMPTMYAKSVEFGPRVGASEHTT